MTKIASTIIASLVVLAGCSKKDSSGAKEPSEMPMPEQQMEADAAAEEAPPPEQPSGALETPVTPPEPVKAMTEEELGQRFDALLAAFNTKDVAQLSGFFTDDAATAILGTDVEYKGQRDVIERLYQPQLWTAFPDLKVTRQLSMVDGKTVVALVHATATNTGPVSSAGPTNKKIGLYGVVHVQFTDDGKIARQALLFDPGVALAQLGILRFPARAADTQGWAENERTIAIASESAAEVTHVSKVKAADLAFAAQNVDLVLADLADDVVYVDLSAPTDVKGKKAIKKNLTAMNKAFSDITIQNSDYLAAGDWVLSRMDYQMTNTGDDPAMKLKKTGKTVKVSEYGFYKFTGDKISRIYGFRNGLSVMAQLGMIAGTDEAGKAPDKTKEKKPATPR